MKQNQFTLHHALLITVVFIILFLSLMFIASPNTKEEIVTTCNQKLSLKQDIYFENN